MIEKDSVQRSESVLETRNETTNSTLLVYSTVKTVTVTLLRVSPLFLSPPNKNQQHLP